MYYINVLNLLKHTVLYIQRTTEGKKHSSGKRQCRRRHKDSKLNQDNGENQRVSLKNISQWFMHVSCHTNKTNVLETCFFHCAYCFL